MVKVFIGNIQEGARASELRAMFEKYGTVTECDILTNFGFVHMQDEEDARSAVKGLDGAFFSGSTIKVEMSHGKQRGERGGRGGRGGGRPRGGRGGGRENGYGGGFGSNRHDPYSRDAYPREPYPSRDPYSREPFPRDPYARDPYERRPPPRDLYERRPPPPRDAYLVRDIYQAPPRDPYAMRSDDIYGPPRDPYARERSPIGRRPPVDAEYAAARRTYASAYDMHVARGPSPGQARRY